MKFICSFLLCFLPLLIGCGDDELTYDEQFKLDSFTKRQYDLYNPITNMLKLDSASGVKNLEYYNYDAYFDEHGTLRYLFYRSGSYGYLQELYYSEKLQLSKVFIYSILVDQIDQGAPDRYNQYFYVNGHLVALRDELDDVVLIIDGDSVIVYEGILSTQSNFRIRKLAIGDYYIRYLSHTVSSSTQE